MPSLLDITQQSKTVRLGSGQELDVFGLSLRDIAGLVKRFPELEGLLAGTDGADPKKAGVAIMMGLVEMFPEAAEATIAMAVARRNSPAADDGIWWQENRLEQERAAGRLSGADQAALLAAAIELSLPANIAGPLLSGGGLFAPPVPAAPGRDPDTPLPPEPTS